MAEIKPFNGIRYNQEKINDISKVVSPPYDIISPEDRVFYHASHPNNFVRLILGEEFETDTDTSNRFTRAKSYLNEWIESGDLKKDSEPSIYLYEQQFDSKVIRGFICAVKIQEYTDEVILPHENTLAKPKGALAELIKQTAANLDCVYGLYTDEAGILDKLMDAVASTVPVIDVHDKDNVRHLLWQIKDAQEVTAMVDFMKDRQIVIADGHHRYETALGYRNEKRAECKSADCGELPSDYALMTLANVFQKDMTIYPTHRMVSNVPEELVDTLESRLTEMFDVSETTRENILSDMEDRGAIGLYKKGRAITLKLKAGSGANLQGCQASRELELNILHELVLDRLLGIDKKKLSEQTNIVYTRDVEEALGKADSDEIQMVFLLNHIAVKSVFDIAAAGERMPQKATYFYPKLLSGLVLRKMD